MSLTTACKNGNIDEAKQIYNSQIMESFEEACVNGHKDVALWLYNMQKSCGTEINVYAKEEYSFKFRWVLKDGNMEIRDYV
jgi:hypothetical protein